MERMTEWNDEQTRHAYYPRCFEEPCYGIGCKIKDFQFETAVCERLAAYEDTGLTPERCAEFARADAEGRYIVMRDAEQEGVARLRELAEADKNGRVAVLPRWKNEEERLERRRLMQIMADGAIDRLMMGNPLKEENGPDIAELRVVNTEEAMKDE